MSMHALESCNRDQLGIWHVECTCEWRDRGSGYGYTSERIARRAHALHRSLAKRRQEEDRRSPGE